MGLDRNQEAFFALLRAGLWEKEVRLLEFGEVDYEEVMRFADEQSVVGLVTAGLEHVKDSKIPKVVLLQFVGQTIQIEETNKGMNLFISELMSRMGHAGIYALIVKGQGIALCYERPLWRASGDVDFYLDESNFQKAKSFFRTLVPSFYPNNRYARHINMHYGPWVVEIHANQRCGLSSRIDKVLDEIHYDLFNGGNVRSCQIGGAQIFLPSVDCDVLIIFTHFLKHFYKGGLGLRQICDWCRLLWTFKDSIDKRLLEQRLSRMGLISEWKAFAAFAVENLGMPKEVMPLYDDAEKWRLKARKIRDIVINMDNFGHNRDTSYYSKYPYLIRKSVSFNRRMNDTIKNATIFPLDSVRFFFNILFHGIRSVFRGE